MRKFGYLIALAAVCFSTIAAASDADGCTDIKAPDKRAVACTRAIASGIFKGNAAHFLYWNRGIAYQDSKDFDKAISDFTQALKLKPKDTSVFNLRGNVYIEKQQFDLAAADFNSALQIDPNDTYAKSRLRSLAQAQRDAAAVASASTDDLKACRELYLKKASIERCTHGIASGKYTGDELTELYEKRGAAYKEELEYDRAIADYTEVIKRLPRNIDLAYRYIVRGHLYLNKKDYNRAIADYNEAIALAPQDKYSYLYLEKAQQLAGVPVTKTVSGTIVSSPVTAETKQPPAEFKPLVAPATVVAKADPEPVISSPPLTPSSPIGKRVALVMGNGDYRSVPKLQNTITDARTMRDTLQKLGFEVIYGENLDKRAMGRQIGEFSTIVRDADAAIVYFAGHGSTFADIPYVVPVDSKYEKLADIPSELVQVEQLVGELRHAKGVRLVILDACRDNEREIELRRQEAAARGEAKRGGNVERGLARLQNPDGLIVVYSTQHLTTAADGAPGGNSPFTGALARHLITPGIDIKDVLFRAGQEVIAKTGGSQRPEISISLYDPFVLAR